MQSSLGSAFRIAAIRPVVLALLTSGGQLRAEPVVATDDQARTLQNTPVLISVLANDSAPATNQLGILRVTAPAHGNVTLNSGVVPASSELLNLFQFAAVQLSNTVVQIANTADTNRYPRGTMTTNALVWRTRAASDWSSGFFPGALWSLYEQTGDTNFSQWAQSWMGAIQPQATLTNTDDLGFMVNCSFGNGYRLTTNPLYQAVLLQAAQSVAARFNPAVGAIGFPGANNIPYDVWLDSIMNMELLFRAFALGGDTNIYSIAYSHAVQTMLNHVRTNGSTYHIVHYDGNTGAVLSRGTYAGAADESTWARGHAWATYGFTMAYRETGDARFLNTAQRVADYYVANAPSDGVPFWDYQYWEYSPTNASRDSSAAAITLSGLLELSQLVTNAAASSNYWWAAHRIFSSLTSTNYLAQENLSSGILLHGVGETPPLWDQEIDVSLIYGDYYFLEALKRYKELYTHTTVTYVPDTNFCGTDSFTYQVCDSAGNSATATVTVVVEPLINPTISFSPVNQRPVISFLTLTGHSYFIQCAEDLPTSPSWRTLATNIGGTGSKTSITDTNIAARQFYRVGLAQ